MNKDLARPPGLVGEICDWIDSTAGKEQPRLSLAAALSYCGALMGRKVQTEWELRTNLYTMGVAPSCSGKEHARTQLNKLTSAAGITDLIGGEDVTSDAAIEMELEKNKTVFYLWDEIGHMMGNIKASGGGGHTAKIVPMLMKMFTSANKTYGGKSYANREEGRRSIDQPHCCVYGTTVPGRLYDGMDSNELVDGWLGRVLVFETDTDPDRNWDSKSKPPPPEIVEQVQYWWNYKPAIDVSKGNIVAAMSVTPTPVPMTPEAVADFKFMEEIVKDLKAKGRKEGIGIDNLWGRSAENAQKLALIVACGDCEEGKLEITKEHSTWACEVIFKITTELCENIRTNVGDNEHDRNRKRLLKVICKAGAHGLTKAEITRKTQWTDKRRRDDLLVELVEGQQLDLWTEKKDGVWRYSDGKLNAAHSFD